jgi:coenzyme F420-reducing hydrogenase beta subunit/Na+-translocating ferredoxin:NAD+ oxidoreductase RnfD subunit
MGIKASVIAPMTKDLLMKYTFVALFFIAFLSFFVFGLDSLLVTIISVGVAVACDFLLSMGMGSRGPRNFTSAAVFGMIVAMSYSLGLPTMSIETIPILAGGIEQYLYPALISAVGLIVFKKLAGLAGRKYVNPAAIAKLLVLGLLFLPTLTSTIMPQDHANSMNLLNPLTESGFEGFPPYYPMETTTLGSNLVVCYGSPSLDQMNPYTYGTFENPLPDVLYNLLLVKYHGWIGGFSSILVIAIGIVLFAVCRRYIKWRITAAYLATTAVFSVVMGFIYGGDIILRALFHLFMGSSIFMAFFMATDPATTPLTRKGQTIFGIGLAILTIIIQTYTGFFGGSILALVIMNLTTPLLDRVGIPKSAERRAEPEINTQYFESARVYDCMRCSACMYICCNSLSPIVIKQAAEKHNVKQMMKLDADYCKNCGDCNLVCPVRIDLRSYMLDYPLKDEEASEIEQQFLKGKADEDLGIYSDMFSAKSSVDGQDGGVATALLVSGMQKGLFDSAVVVQRTDGYWAEAVAAENVDDLMKAKGTTYLRIPLVSTLRKLIMKGKRKIAIIGMACDVRSTRRVQQVLLREFPDLELSVIGLFCYECFDYEKLKEETKRLLGVDLDQAEKTQISKGKYIVKVDGKESSVRVKELNDAVEKMCLICPDFTAQYADISVGSVGSDDGYSTVIVRSDVGKELWENLDLGKGKVKKEDLTKLSVNKKKRAKKNQMDL